MNDLAKALNKDLGKFEKVGSGRDIHYENDDAIITSAVGHLVELRMADGPERQETAMEIRCAAGHSRDIHTRSHRAVRAEAEESPQVRETPRTSTSSSMLAMPAGKGS